MTRDAAAVPAGRERYRPGRSAAAAGLVRSAQSENPGRLVLADLPAGAAAAAAGGAGDRVGLAGLLAAALSSGEPEVAMRDGAVFGRRLVRLSAAPHGPADQRPRVPGTVLVTGGTGTLGGLVARHLAVTDRARRLTPGSLRSRPDCPGDGAAGRRGSPRLRARGCGWQRVTPPTGMRLAGLLGLVPPDCPLTGCGSCSPWALDERG